MKPAVVLFLGASLSYLTEAGDCKVVVEKKTFGSTGLYGYTYPLTSTTVIPFIKAHATVDVDCIGTDGFANFSKLNKLEIKEQDFSGGLNWLNDPIFYSMKNFYRLKLSNNKIVSVPAGIFDKFRNITEIDLQDNGPIGFPVDVFDKFGALKEGKKLRVDDCTDPCSALASTAPPGTPCGMTLGTSNGPGTCKRVYLPCTYYCVDKCVPGVQVLAPDATKQCKDDPRAVYANFVLGCASTQVPHSNFAKVGSLGGTPLTPPQTVVCDAGYTLNGSASVQCNSVTGLWNVPTCVAIDGYCSSASTLSNGAMNCASASIGTRCSYTCNNAYSPTSTSAVCSAGGSSAGSGVWAASCTNQPIDGCAGHGNCQAGGDMGAQCIDNVSGPGYTCLCRETYVFSPQQGTCLADTFNYCEGHTKCTDRGDAAAVCTSGASSFSCTCSAGFFYNGASCEANALNPNPTPAPTNAPVTVAPTNAPVTVAPTNAPTNAPVTAAPTNAPTNAPVVDAPTNAPTNAPVVDAPTNAPVVDASTTGLESSSITASSDSGAFFSNASPAQIETSVISMAVFLAATLLG